MGRDTDRTVVRLLHSHEPSVRWKVRVHVLAEDPASPRLRRLQDEVRRSPRVRRLLEGHDAAQPATYAKWVGAHWVLATLADLGHPQGDEALLPMRDRLFRTWLGPTYFVDLEDPRPGAGSRGVPRIAGRSRRCGSQQGSALLSVVRLGLEGDGAARLVERLQHWQWPDGGWNCDKKPGAASSSLHETLLPMRGLAAYAAAHDDAAARVAAERAAEVLLTRRVVFRRTAGREHQVVSPDWAALHYPAYWHYDLLGGLRGLAELALVRDDRCADALDLLEAQRLPDGGWPAAARYYKRVDGAGGSAEHVDWGGASRRRSNEWVTVDALAVLAAAGRL